VSGSTCGLRSLSQISARQVSDETTCVGWKCCRAKVLFPAPAISHSTMSVLAEICMSCDIPFSLPLCSEARSKCPMRVSSNTHPSGSTTDGKTGLAEPFVESSIEMAHRWPCFPGALHDHGGIETRLSAVLQGGSHSTIGIDVRVQRLYSASAHRPRTISSAMLSQSMLPG